MRGQIGLFLVGWSGVSASLGRSSGRSSQIRGCDEFANLAVSAPFLRVEEAAQRTRGGEYMFSVWVRAADVT